MSGTYRILPKRAFFNSLQLASGRMRAGGCHANWSGEYGLKRLSRPVLKSNRLRCSRALSAADDPAHTHWPSSAPSVSSARFWRGEKGMMFSRLAAGASNLHASLSHFASRTSYSLFLTGSAVPFASDPTCAATPRHSSGFDNCFIGLLPPRLWDRQDRTKHFNWEAVKPKKMSSRYAHHIFTDSR